MKKKFDEIVYKKILSKVRVSEVNGNKVIVFPNIEGSHSIIQRSTLNQLMSYRPHKDTWTEWMSEFTDFVYGDLKLMAVHEDWWDDMLYNTCKAVLSKYDTL